MFGDLLTYQEFLGVTTAQLNNTDPVYVSAVRALIELRSPLAAQLEQSAPTELLAQALIPDTNQIAGTGMYGEDGKGETLAPVIDSLALNAERAMQEALDKLQLDPTPFVTEEWDNWQRRLPRSYWRLFVETIYAHYVMHRLGSGRADPRWRAAMALLHGNAAVIESYLVSNTNDSQSSQSGIRRGAQRAMLHYLETTKV